MGGHMHFSDLDRQVRTRNLSTTARAEGLGENEGQGCSSKHRDLLHGVGSSSCLGEVTANKSNSYKQNFSLLDPLYPKADQANIRNIISTSDPTIAYIGFVRPGVGAIPPIAEQQAMWWTALITENMCIPKDSPHYHLLAGKGARINYGVDHSAYMSALAKDFGGAPGIIKLWQRHGWRVLLTYCFGASFVTFYRLVGPFESADAPGITTGELAETVLRRGKLGNLFFGIIPMLFYGLLNAVAWIVDCCGLIPQVKEMEVDIQLDNPHRD